jgi:hypothetical protein
MNVIFDILIRFFTAVCNASLQLFQNKSAYLIGIGISYIELRNDNTEKHDTLNSEYTVSKSKYIHSSYQHLLGYINFYFEYKTHT